MGVQFIGQSQGLIHDVPTVDDLMQRIMQEAHDVSLDRAALFVDESNNINNSGQSVEKEEQ